MLMLDTIPYSIGILVSEESNETYFEPVICCGDKFPSSGIKKCLVEKNDKFVSLDIYEERLEFDSLSGENVYLHTFLGQYDVPIEGYQSLNENEANDDTMFEVEVIFNFSELGLLTFNVQAADNNNQIDQEDEKGGKSPIFLLYFYIFLLALTYVGFKIFFGETLMIQQYVFNNVSSLSTELSEVVGAVNIEF